MAGLDGWPCSTIRMHPRRTAFTLIPCLQFMNSMRGDNLGEVAQQSVAELASQMSGLFDFKP